MTRQQALDTLANNTDLRASLIWLYDNGYEVVSTQEIVDLINIKGLPTVSIDNLSEFYVREEGDG